MKCFNGNGFKETKRAIALLMAALWLYGLLAGPALAGPTGGVVTSGSASIVQSGNTTNINQSTNKASINWQTLQHQARRDGQLQPAEHLRHYPEQGGRQ